MGRMFKSPKFYKLLGAIAVIAGISVGGFFLFDALGLMNPEAMEETLSGFGFWLYVVYIVLFIVQAVFLSFIPGNTTLFITAGFLLFGGNFWITLAVGSISVILASIALYMVGRFGGRNLMFWLFGKENIERRLDWVGTKGTNAVPWLFLIPFMPTDLICLICGASKMRFWQFMLIVMVFRPFEVLLLIAYNFLIPMILDHATIFELILLVNVMVINLVLLVLYHKTLLKFFRKYTSPIRDVFRMPEQQSPTKAVGPCCANAEVQTDDVTRVKKSKPSDN